ncbi:MAG: asparagine--tRNA ligase [Kiritimatiellaeota bacterium]|nr:asparagine--tRNA ligase [Kiritimatiellota bacterium]
MQRELIRAVLERQVLRGTVRVAGWVRTRRDSKAGVSFVALNDGSCFQNLQVVAPDNLDNYASEVRRLHPGCSIVVTGELTPSPGRGQDREVRASQVRVLGWADPEVYPLGKQRVSFERLREIAHLRPRTNTFGAVTRVRNCLARSAHRFFQERAFYYIHTPIITGSDCEGAGALFRVTTLGPEGANPGEHGADLYRGDFFGRQTFLTVSGQLEAEAYACALGRVYTFGPTFRAEDSNTRRHLAEFWMIEPEVAFADLNENADLACDFLRFLCNAVLEECSDDLAFFEERIAPGVMDRLQSVATSDFTRMTYTEAVDLLARDGHRFEFSPKYGCDLQSEHERYLTETACNGPVVLTDYPREIKPFYMRVNEDDRTVAAMDVLLPGVGEIIGGSQREERLEMLLVRMRETGVDPDDYQWYVDLRRFGTVPHAGFGLGFERMIQFATGMANIRDVIPFPRTPRNAEF